MATQVILLERVEKLGQMGDVVNVKPGYARNFLLPKGKALRATKDNVTYFEKQKTELQKISNTKKDEAEKTAKSLKDLKVALVRQASEGGQLYGSVTARDIADATAALSKQAVTREMVALNQNFKTLGLFPVDVILHPEVRVSITINIARSADEAAIQEKTGKALIADDGDDADKGSQKQKSSQAKDTAESGSESDESLDKTKAEFLEDSALQAEKEKAETDAKKQAEKDAKAQAKADAQEAKKAAKSEEESADAQEGAVSASEDPKNDEPTEE